MRFLVGFCGALLLLLNIQFTLSQITIPLEKRSIDPRSIPALRNRKATNRKNVPLRASLMNAYYNIMEPLNFNLSLYIGNVKVGSQNETFSVVFDTGSDVLWLPAPGCEGCPKGKTFDCSDSTTCSQSGNYNTREYGSGDIGGYEVTDNVKMISNFSVSYQFIAVDEGAYLNDFPSNGLMGLNNDESEDNFVDLAYAGGYIVDKVYSFKLAQEAEAEEDPSYLNIGFIPPAHVNKLAWVPATDSQYWSTDVLAMTVNDQNIPFGDDSDIDSVLFDSGTSDILIANPVYEVVVQLLSDNGCTINDYNDVCDCGDAAIASYPNITFTTRGANFTVTPRQYLLPYTEDECQVLLGNTYLPDAGTSAGRQILGVPFLINNFVTFSKRNQSMGIDAEYMNLLTPMNDRIYFWSAIGAVALMFVVLVLIQILQRRFKPKAVEQQAVGVIL